MYLADKTGRFLPKDTAARYEVIQWLMVQLTSIGPMFGQLTHFKMFAPAGNDYALSRYQTEVRRLYDLLEERLGQSQYLGGADYGIADIATFPWTGNMQMHGIKLEDNPNLARWHGAISARPAVQRALKKVERDQVEPRARQARAYGPVLRPRPICAGLAIRPMGPQKKRATGRVR